MRPFLALLLLLLATPAQARHPRHAERQAGGFDFYLFTLSLAPSFCAATPANQQKAECRLLTDEAFRATPLTVHGLWPNRAGVSVNLQPQHCDGPPLGALPPDIVEGLRRYMPAGPGLAAYEWRKHGTCSGLPPAEYFATILRLARSADDTVGRVLRDRSMLGRRVTVRELLDAVAERDPALAPALVVNCRTPRGGGGGPAIEEIRIVLSKSFEPMPASSAGMGQNSGCLATGARLPMPAGA